MYRSLFPSPSPSMYSTVHQPTSPSLSSVFKTRHLFTHRTPHTPLDPEAQALPKTYSPYGGWGPCFPELAQTTYVRPETISRAPVTIADREVQSEWRPKTAAIGSGDSATSTTPTTQISGFPSPAQQPQERFPEPPNLTLGTCAPARRAEIHTPATATLRAQAMEAEICDSDDSDDEERPLLPYTSPPLSTHYPHGWDLAGELGAKSPLLLKLGLKIETQMKKSLIIRGPPSSVYSQYSPCAQASPLPRKGGAEGMTGHPLANAMMTQEERESESPIEEQQEGRPRRSSAEDYNELVNRWRRISCPDTPTETSTPALPESDLKVPGAWPMIDGTSQPVGLKSVVEEKPESPSISDCGESGRGLEADKTFSGTSSSPLAKSKSEFELPTDGAEDLPKEKFPDACVARKVAFRPGLMSPMEAPVPLKRRKRSNAADSAPNPPVVKDLGEFMEAQEPRQSNKDILRKGDVISAFQSGLRIEDRSQSDHGEESPAPESPGDDKARASLDTAVGDQFKINIADEESTGRGSHSENLGKHIRREVNGSYKENLDKHINRTEEPTQCDTAPIDNGDNKIKPIFRECGSKTLAGGNAILAAKRYENLKRDNPVSGNKAEGKTHAKKETKNFSDPLYPHPPAASVESASESDSESEPKPQEVEDSSDDITSPSSTTTTCGSNSSTRSSFKVSKAKTWPCGKGYDGVSAELCTTTLNVPLNIRDPDDSATQPAEGEREEKERGRSATARSCTSTNPTRDSPSTPRPSCKNPPVVLSLRGGGGPGLQRSTGRAHHDIGIRAVQRAEKKAVITKLSATVENAFSNDPHPDYYYVEDEGAPASSQGHRSPSSLGTEARSSRLARQGTFAPPNTAYSFSSKSPYTAENPPSAWGRTAQTASGNQHAYKQSKFTEAIEGASESWPS